MLYRGRTRAEEREGENGNGNGMETVTEKGTKARTVTYNEMRTCKEGGGVKHSGTR